MPYKRRKREGVIYVAPAVVVLFFLTIYPIIYFIYLSFFEIKGWDLSKASFTGLTNYIKVLTDPLFLKSLQFTSLYTCLALLIELPVGLLLAFFLNELVESKRKTVKPFTILILLPILLPGVATAMMFSLMLNDLIGIIPHLIELIFKVKISLLSEAVTATLVLIVVDAWQWAPFFFLLIYAGFRMVPRDIIDAACIDGAGRWQILAYISLPMVKYMITVALVLRGIWLFRSFDVPKLLTGGGPGISTRTVSLQIYEYSFKEGLIGIAAAATFVVFILVNIVVLIYYKYIMTHREEVL